MRIIDLHISDLSDAHSHLDVRRHGTPVVLHDPDGLIVLERGGRRGARWRPRSTRSRQRRSTDEWLVNRALARGHPAEAVDFYLRFALATLVRLVRVEHCPWRHDFGLRYLREDLPRRRRRPARGAGARVTRPGRCVTLSGDVLRLASTSCSASSVSGSRCAPAVRGRRARAPWWAPRQGPRDEAPEDQQAEHEERQVGHHGDEHDQPRGSRTAAPAGTGAPRHARCRLGGGVRRTGRAGAVRPARQVAEERPELGLGLGDPAPGRGARRARRRTAGPGRSARPGPRPRARARRRRSAAGRLASLTTRRPRSRRRRRRRGCRRACAGCRRGRRPRPARWLSEPWVTICHTAPMTWPISGLRSA